MKRTVLSILLFLLFLPQAKANNVVISVIKESSISATVGMGIVSATDLAVQEVKQEYIKDGSITQYQQIFDKWDVFYTGAAILDGGTNVAALAKSMNVIRLGNNLRTLVKSTTAMTKTALRDNLTALYAKWILEVKGLKNIDNLTAAERQLLNEQDEMFRMLGASQYSATGKALTWEEAVKMVSSKLPPFQVGDEIAGIKVTRIKSGTNGKIAIIGRAMGNQEMRC